MDPDRLGREYVRLGLACDRLSPGLVDCYVGPARERRRVAAEPAPDPAALAARARWLREELPRSGLSPTRADFLDRQLAALRCALRRVAGAPVGYRAEVLAYFDTEVTCGEPDTYRAAHDELADLLPGAGDLGARLAAFRGRTRVPAAVLAPAVQRVAAVLRDRARAAFDLPLDEEVQFELVSDRPWSAFHRYLGGGRSRVSVNTETGPGVGQLARLIAHETYPGHHVEHVQAEDAADAPGELPERTLFLLNTPQCLVSEGQADVGLEVLAGPAHGAWLSGALDGLPGRPGVELVELALRVDAVFEALAPVRQDAALLLHDRGRSVAEVSAYLRRWLLVDERRAGQMLRFVTHPRWRAYTTTYVEGRRLVRAWLDRPAEGGPAERVVDRYLGLRRHPRSPSTLRRDLGR